VQHYQAFYVHQLRFQMCSDWTCTAQLLVSCKGLTLDKYRTAAHTLQRLIERAHMHMRIHPPTHTTHTCAHTDTHTDDVMSVGPSGLTVLDEAKYKERRESAGVFTAIPSLLRCESEPVLLWYYAWCVCVCLCVCVCVISYRDARFTLQRH
jgi:hypothetical protein